MTAAGTATLKVLAPSAIRDRERERVQDTEARSARPGRGGDDAATVPSVRFSRIGKTYAGAGGPVHALRGIDLEIRRGEVFGFIGRSGAGKSSLIRLINRLEQPTEGVVSVNGVDTAPFDEDALVALRRRIGMIFQHFNLMSAKTVAENVALPLVMAGRPKAGIGPRVQALLELVGLSDKHGAHPAQLSGGQKQRVGIARALVHEPDILLCDEATSALDPETTQSILALLRDINRRLGITVVLITHEMAVIREVCDRVAVLERGEVVEHGAVWEVFGAPRHAVTRALLGQVNHGLPGDLAARLRPASPGDTGTWILRIGFDGTGGLPEMAALTRALGGGAIHLLDSSLDRIQGRTFGHLLVGIPAGAAAFRADAFPGARMEVLGHVADRL